MTTFWLSLAGFVLAMLAVALGPTWLLDAFWRVLDWRRGR